MTLLQKLQAILAILQEVQGKAPQIQQELEDLSTFLDTV